MSTIQGKWALVTGSSRGIGRAVASALAQCGCNVVVHARSAKHTAETVQQVLEHGVESFPVGADLSQPDQLERLIDAVVERIGGVDILYNNAAVMSPWRDAYEFSIAEWQDLFNVNVFAAARLCAAFIPIMKERGYGRVVNVSSGIKMTPQLLPYAASKWAIDKLTEELAHGFEGTNVLINAIDPGWIKTDMGGEQADHDLDTVIPGMLVPALFDRDGPSGRKFQAQDFKALKVLPDLDAHA